MAAPLQAFESSWKKDIEKKQLREARARYLEKAEADFERREKKKDDAKKRGEGTWMLPALSERIDQDELAVKRSKAKKQKKEKKEKKKKKKSEKEKSKSKKSKKKKKKDADSDDSSSDSSDSESDGAVEWVAKTARAPTTAMGPKLERQDWMVDPLADIFGGVTRDQIKAQKKKDAGEVEEEKQSVIDQMGQHDRELNPYWKDGGKGLPEQAPDKKAKKDRSSGGAGGGGVAGDGGLSWLRRSHQRCVEAAQEEGRTVEEVAAERYGSLKKLEKMIAEAEKKLKTEESRSRGGYERDRNRDRDRDRDRGNDRDRGRGSGGLAGRFQRPGDMSSSGSSSSSQSQRRTFIRPGGDDGDQPQRRKMAFMKPGEERESSRQSSSSSDRQGWRKRDDRDDVPRWKKATGEGLEGREKDRGRDRSRSRERDRDRKRDRSKSRERSRDRDRSRSRDRQRPRDRSRSKERDTKRRRSSSRSPSKDRDRRRSRSSSRNSSASSDSSSDSGSESDQPASESEPEPEPVKVLTEDELNALGAKILRAELMGNEEAAASLKAQLEEARKVKAAAGTAAPVRVKKEKDGDDVVVLTRTDRAGNVRPLPQAKHERGEGGKRKKKEKMATHGKDGRERYFADDDRYNLNDLVKQEKMSTAEDANAMFARLAGRSTEKTDEDHQIDDVMVNQANKKLSDAKIEEQERSAAIFEHRHMSKALDNCKFCFENVPKHLIIAIGIKVYLCLPAHRSMVPGHCLIVPMQHAVSGTAVDDDVWAEVQVFRKGLTAMFREQEEDVVFMETSMHLRRYPHMVVECVPMPQEVGDMAPIYFKKAIQESDTEWTQNKKLIDLSKKNVRASVPKGFPYFCVDFGLSGGFAHVIEDEQIFPTYFGREIAGGMMDIEPMLWRKPHKEEFEQQRQKVLTFAAWWKPYDWTQKLKVQKESDSD